MRLEKGILHLLGRSCFKNIALMMLLLSCGKKDEEKRQIEFLLSNIAIDYHSVRYDLLTEADDLYPPENVILTFVVTNDSEAMIDLPLYSKSNPTATLSAFYMVYKADTVNLESVSDKLRVEPNSKGIVTTELPFQSYGVFRELFEEATGRKKGSQISSIRIGFKMIDKSSLDHKSVGQEGAKVFLSCSDTTRVVINF